VDRQAGLRDSYDHAFLVVRLDLREEGFQSCKKTWRLIRVHSRDVYLVLRTGGRTQALNTPIVVCVRIARFLNTTRSRSGGIVERVRGRMRAKATRTNPCPSRCQKLWAENRRELLDQTREMLGTHIVGCHQRTQTHRDSFRTDLLQNPSRVEWQFGGFPLRS